MSNRPVTVRNAVHVVLLIVGEGTFARLQLTLALGPLILGQAFSISPGNSTSESSLRAARSLPRWKAVYAAPFAQKLATPEPDTFACLFGIRRPALGAEAGKFRKKAKGLCARPAQAAPLACLSLSGKRELARRVALLQRLHLPVFHNELIDGIGELWCSELQAFHLSQLPRRRTREHE